MRVTVKLSSCSSHLKVSWRKKMKNSMAVLAGALEAVFVVRSLPVRGAELASLGGAPCVVLYGLLRLKEKNK